MDALSAFISYPFLQRALLASLAVALLCAVLGVYVVLRGLSLLGDGLAHLSLAGVALGLVAGIYPLAVALGMAVVGALAIQALRSRGLVRGDTAIGILFTAGLAFGVLVISKSRGFSVDLNAYLFGNVLAVTPTEILLVASLAVGLAVALALLRKELLYLTFNEEAARLSGLPVGALNTVFTILTATAIVVAARVVGILLVSALLVVPAASSLLVAKSFRVATWLSAAFAGLSVLGGLFAAVQWGLATGASIALASTLVFAAVLAARPLLAGAK